MAEKKNVPELRFGGFDDNWVERKLGNMVESLEYGLNAAATEFDGKNKYLRITDIDDDTRLFKQDDITSPAIDLTNTDSYKLEVGDILFARTGASVGKTYRYKESDGLVYFAGFLIRARTKLFYSSEFVYQNTLTRKYDDFIKIMSQRSGQPGVNAQEYASFEIITPSAEKEQTAIGNFFRNLDETITLKNQQHEKLVNIKKSMLEKMFPQKGANVPEIRFDGFVEPWVEKELEYLADYAKGRGYSKSDLVEEGFPIILYGKLYTNYETVISQIDTFVNDNSNAVISKGNEVIVPASGETAEDISRASVVEHKGVVLGGDLNIIYLRDEIDAVFLALSISNGSQKRELIKRAQGKTVVHLHNSDLKKLALCYPRDKKEQTAIGNFFRALDTLITESKQEIEKLKTIKKSCLEKMFI